jgi:hypothetical protein
MATVSWGVGGTVTLTIATSAQTSDVLDMNTLHMHSCPPIGMITPAAFTGTITIQVSDAEDGTFVNLQSEDVDIALPTSRALVLEPVPFQFLRLASSTQEGGDRDVYLKAVMRK